MDWLKGKLQRRNKTRNDFEKVWHRHRRLSPSTLVLVSRVAVDVREKISQGRVDCLQICHQIYHHVNSNVSDLAELVEEHRLLLLEVLDIMATHRVQARPFIRDVLTLLFQISKVVDREVYLYELSKSDGPLESLNAECREKMRYTLGNIAGWKLTTSEPWVRPGVPPAEFYLDLPLRRASSPATTHLMAEALFRLQDPEIILDLLRHGGSPSCIYLWPVIVMMDLKFVMQNPEAATVVDAVALAESTEARMIRYFCRARRTVYVNPIRASEVGSARIPPDISYEDVLLIPRQMTFLVPEDRHKRPARLQHLCRLLIRQTLLAADSIPRGIYQLPVPAILRRYIDLLL